MRANVGIEFDSNYCNMFNHYMQSKAEEALLQSHRVGMGE